MDAEQASLAELAVENERLQRALRARLDESEALRRVATLVASRHDPDAVLSLVTEEVARHLSAAMAATMRYDGGDRATVVASWTAPGLAPRPAAGSPVWRIVSRPSAVA